MIPLPRVMIAAPSYTDRAHTCKNLKMVCDKLIAIPLKHLPVCETVGDMLVLIPLKSGTS